MIHLNNIENDLPDTSTCFNKYESIFCPTYRIEKKKFIEKWKSISSKSEFKYSIGRVFTNKEANLIKRLQAYNIIGSSFCSNHNKNKIILYMSCITKEKILILLEIILLKSKYLYVDFKYKSGSLRRENELEMFLTIILSNVDEKEKDNIIGR